MEPAKSEDRHGLSARGWANVEGIMPKIQGALKDHENPDNGFIDLSSAESWILRPEQVEICKTAIADRFTTEDFSYARKFGGYPSVLEAFVKVLNAYFNPHIPVEIDHLACAPGAASCLDTLFYNICDSGDAILFAAPYYNRWSLVYATSRSSVKAIPVAADDLQGCLSPEAFIPALERALEKTDSPVKGLLVTNPNNPLAQCYPKAFIEECIKFCHRHNIHYMSDEVYALTSFSAPDQEQLPTFVSALSVDVKGIGCDPSRVHVVWSTSKDFGQNGMRMGCSVTQANPEMNAGLILASFTTTSSLSALLASAVLSSDDLPKLIDLNSTRLCKAYVALTKVSQQYNIPYLPANAGMYLFAKIAPTAKTWEEEAAAVQRFGEGGLLVSPGRGYNGPEGEKGWARIGFALEEDTMGEALKRIDNVLSKRSTEQVVHKY